MSDMRHSISRLLAIACLLVASPTCAADWKIIPAKSRLGFEGTMAGVAFEGRFLRWEGRISFDPAQSDRGGAVVTIDMSSAETGDRQKDAALPQSDWFDAKTFPKATFEAQSFRGNSGNAYEAIGTLTIRDVKKPVVMPTTIEVTGTTLHATGHLDLVRSDYGVGQGAWTSDQWVALNVGVTFEVTCELASAPLAAKSPAR
jgi:polyisoprenoid-binding protein YceI